MSGRKIGGGRVLGSGRNILAPAPPNPNLLSPSASTVSVNSDTTSTPSTDPNDLSSRVSLEQNGSLATASAMPGPEENARLFCPICNEDMVTLLQLNRHLDDNHKDIEEYQQDEVKDWFDRQVEKAKRFQPLAVLNQKFKGLDVFEPNNMPRSPEIRPTTSKPEPRPPDPEEVVTRSHWQRRGLADECGEPACGKRLSPANGSVNCRHCGKLFCDEHTLYQMKLSRSAQHEPVRGMWCRVCETCYKSREGYNDRHGLEKNDTEEFKKLRGKHVDRTLLEVSRLEKRLTKLTQLLAKPLEPNITYLWPLGGAKAQRKELEQSVVDWEDDATVSRCPYCHQEFSNYTFRRHHCRICGRVVCADPATDCSKDVPLTVSAQSTSNTEKPSPLQQQQIPLDIRICKECNATLFSRSDYQASLSQLSPSQKAYTNLTSFETGIRALLPKFHRLLSMLQSPDTPPTPAQLADASRTRRRLVDAFGHYSTAARRLRDLPTDSPTQKKLQQAVYQQSYNFLQLHMLPLKALPKILKHASAAAPGLPPNGPTGKPIPALASIKYNAANGASPSGGGGSDTHSLTSSSAATTTAISDLEAEEKSLRETLIVLEEQAWLVQNSMQEAIRKRRFDEAKALKGNSEDLEVEIGRLRGRLGGLDFEGVYNAAAAAGGVAA